MKIKFTILSGVFFPKVGLFFCFLCFSIGVRAQSEKYLQDSLPNAWIQSELFEQTLPSEDRWWMQFQDTLLEKLVLFAVEQNYDLLMAADRMDMAKASMRVQQSGFYPHIDITAGWMPQEQSLGLNPSLAGQRYSQIGSAQVNLSWEVDIIGKIRNSAKAEKQMYRASQSEYNAVMVSLCSQVASLYFNLRTVQAQIQVAKANLSSQKDILSVTESRFTAGIVSALDVAQAKTVYESTRASIPGLEAQLLSYINAIGVLLGQYPWALREELMRFSELPKRPAKIAVGIPADVIRQRPDITAAEKNILAAAAQLGATKADWWPKFYVNASFGYGAENFKGFGTSDNMFWQIGPSLKWNIFSGLQQNQSTKIAKSTMDMKVSNYNQTILIALQEVDNAMNMYSKSLEQTQANRAAVDQAKLTLALSLDLYRQGLAEFQNVLDAQRYLFNYETAWVVSEGSSYQYLIQLYKSLGGGWSVDTSLEETK